MADTFKNVMDKSGPGERHFEFTFSDTVDEAITTRGIFCAEAGTAVVVDAAGTALSYTMTAGQMLPFRCKRINATGSTGTYYGWY